MEIIKKIRKIKNLNLVIKDTLYFKNIKDNIFLIKFKKIFYKMILTNK